MKAKTGYFLSVVLFLAGIGIIFTPYLILGLWWLIPVLWAMSAASLIATLILRRNAIDPKHVGKRASWIFIIIVTGIIGSIAYLIGSLVTSIIRT